VDQRSCSPPAGRPAGAPASQPGRVLRHSPEWQLTARSNRGSPAPRRVLGGGLPSEQWCRSDPGRSRLVVRPRCMTMVVPSASRELIHPAFDQEAKSRVLARRRRGDWSSSARPSSWRPRSSMPRRVLRVSGDRPAGPGGQLADLRVPHRGEQLELRVDCGSGVLVVGVGRRDAEERGPRLQMPLGRVVALSLAQLPSHSAREAYGVTDDLFTWESRYESGELSLQAPGYRMLRRRLHGSVPK
jgi:hypothetical protein